MCVSNLVFLQKTVHCLGNVGSVDGIVVGVRAVIPFFNETCEQMLQKYAFRDFEREIIVLYLTRY